MNISGTLSAYEIITGKISSGDLNTQDLSTALQALSKLPKNPVKTINGIPAGEDGNVQLAPIDQSYTAFAVYPTSADIEAGTTHEYFGEVLETIPAGNIHLMGIRYDNGDIPLETNDDGTIKFPENIDIKINWGDSDVDEPLSAACKPFTLPKPINNVPDTIPAIRKPSGSKNEYTFFVWHKYEVTDREYIVKIKGNDWMGLSLNYAQLIDELGKTHCLTSRFLDKDLPMKDTITSLAYFCSGSYRLTKIDVPSAMDLTVVNHIFRMFQFCKNLRSVNGFNNKFSVLSDSYGAFGKCPNLEFCDFKLPSTFASDVATNTLAGVFQDCTNLQGYFEDFLPNKNTNLKRITGSGMFSNCGKLKIRDIDDLASHLWNAPEDIRIKTARMFDGCDADSVLPYIPTAFGGSLSTEFKTLLQRIVDLEAKVAALEAQQ